MPRNDDEWDDMEEEIDGMEVINPHKQVEEHDGTQEDQYPYQDL